VGAGNLHPQPVPRGDVEGDSLRFKKGAVLLAEIARQVGVCTSAVAKAIQTIEGGGEK
jgi:hypothetical protein